jgi:vancomycin resistance protein YoaR
VRTHHKLLKFVVISTGLLTGAGAVTFAAYGRQPDGVIADQVFVAGMDWSKMPASQARTMLETWRQERLGETVTLKLPPEAKSQKQWTPTRADLGADVDMDATLADALAIGKDENAVTRLIGILMGRQRVDLTPRWQIDEKKLQKYLSRQIAPGVNVPPRDARFLPRKVGFNVIPERPGTRLDNGAILALLSEQLLQQNLMEITLPVKVVAPKVTREDFKEITGEISRFSTYISGTRDRKHNVRLASSKIHGIALRPGDTFSFNDVVGPRTPKAGFRMAPVIVQGRKQEGWGGGACQVSSTLFNVALLADLKILRRQSHSIPSTYISLGRDATVDYGSIDLKFQNVSDSTVVLAAEVVDNRMLMRVFGKPMPGKKIEIVRTSSASWGGSVRTISDPTLPAGKRVTVESGRSGRRATIARIIKMDGKEVRRDYFSSYYPPLTGTIRLGTGPAAPKPGAPKPPASTTPPATAGGAQTHVP